MTDFFNYEYLTWPEVAELPRNTPLILPLGNGYSLNHLAEHLRYPAHIALLPPFPFGWRNSGLEVPEAILAPYINNLLSSLREDGFTKVYALTPEQTISGIHESDCIRLPSIQSQNEFIPPSSEKNKVIIIPIGHTEQHALHLPLNVDTVSIQAVANGTASTVPEQAYSLPTMPYGVSTHRSSFAATLNAGGRAFEDFWLEVIHTLTLRGFDRFYFMSGHGGNTSFLVNIVKYAGERHKRIFCATAYLYLSSPDGISTLEKYRTSNIGGMGHACELETSFMLHLRPELVHMERVRDDIDFISTPSYYMDWVEGGALVANPSWYDDSIYGAYGAGSLATAEKGAVWLKAAIQEKVKHVAEIHEQQIRREQRRQNGFGLWGNKKDAQ